MESHCSFSGITAGYGDFAEMKCNDEGFSGAEFGVAVMPGAVTYRLGYLIENEDDTNGYSSAFSEVTTSAKGGMYFAVQLDY